MPAATNTRSDLKDCIFIAIRLEVATTWVMLVVEPLVMTSLLFKRMTQGLSISTTVRNGQHISAVPTRVDSRVTLACWHTQPSMRVVELLA